MAELMRVAALTGYRRTMAALGVDHRPLLAEQGLTAGMLVNPEQPIPALAALRLLERSAEATGCMTLGLRMAEGRPLSNLGATSLLIEHQPNLGAALSALSEFRSRINSTLALQILDDGTQAILREDFSLANPQPMRQSLDLTIGVLARMCEAVHGPGWAPLAVCFSHQAPPVAELPIYFRLFHCRPEFDSEFNGLVVASRDLDRPNPRADSQLARHARDLLEAALKPGERTVAQEVEQLINLLLPTGRATVQTCAASLGLTVRTLQRRLGTENAEFSQLLHRARKQLATQYLANPRMRITDVAQLLGYGSIGAFTRWHAQTFGQSPLKWRQALS